MYKNIIETMTTELNFQYENGIMKAVQDVGVIVDKEELVKALMYDRNQYDEGYRDGKKDAMKWIPVSEQPPKEGECLLVTYKSVDGEYFVTQETFRKENLYGLWEVVAWMPSIEPYKGE